MFPTTISPLSTFARPFLNTSFASLYDSCDKFLYVILLNRVSAAEELLIEQPPHLEQGAPLQM